MTKQLSKLEHVVYWIACIFSFGGIYVLRIVITLGVLKANEEFGESDPSFNDSQYDWILSWSSGRNARGRSV
jgi:hypothetical protein